MYEELIDELRLESANMHYAKADCELFAKAADAIEDLQTRCSILEMMRGIGGLWGFGRDGRLYRLKTADIFDGCKTVQVFPEKEGET